MRRIIEILYFAKAKNIVRMPYINLAYNMTLSTLLILALYAGRMSYIKLVYGVVRLVAQWLKHLTGLRKVIGSTSVGDLDFSFVPLEIIVISFLISSLSLTFAIVLYLTLLIYGLSHRSL